MEQMEGREGKACEEKWKKFREGEREGSKTRRKRQARNVPFTLKRTNSRVESGMTTGKELLFLNAYFTTSELGTGWQ